VRTANLNAFEKSYLYLGNLLAYDNSPLNHKSHRIFLERAISICYNINQAEATKELFTHYKENDYNNIQEKDLTFDEFVLGGLIKTLKFNTVKETSALIQSVITSNFKSAEARNHDMANGLRNRAFKMYSSHQKQYGNSSKRLPPFKEMEAALKSALYQSTPSRMKQLDEALKITRKTKRKTIKTKLIHNKINYELAYTIELIQPIPKY
jgi:hypothetical protein